MIEETYQKKGTPDISMNTARNQFTARTSNMDANQKPFSTNEHASTQPNTPMKQFKNQEKSKNYDKQTLKQILYNDDFFKIQTEYERQRLVKGSSKQCKYQKISQFKKMGLSFKKDQQVRKLKKNSQESLEFDANNLNSGRKCADIMTEFNICSKSLCLQNNSLSDDFKCQSCYTLQVPNKNPLDEKCISQNLESFFNEIKDIYQLNDSQFISKMSDDSQDVYVWNDKVLIEEESKNNLNYQEQNQLLDDKFTFEQFLFGKGKTPKWGKNDINLRLKFLESTQNSKQSNLRDSQINQLQFNRQLSNSMVEQASVSLELSKSNETLLQFSNVKVNFTKKSIDSKYFDDNYNQVQDYLNQADILDTEEQEESSNVKLITFQSNCFSKDNKFQFMNLDQIEEEKYSELETTYIKDFEKSKNNQNGIFACGFDEQEKACIQSINFCHESLNQNDNRFQNQEQQDVSPNIQQQQNQNLINELVKNTMKDFEINQNHYQVLESLSSQQIDQSSALSMNSIQKSQCTKKSMKPNQKVKNVLKNIEKSSHFKIDNENDQTIQLTLSGFDDFTTQIATWEEMNDPQRKQLPSQMDTTISMFKINDCSQSEIKKQMLINFFRKKQDQLKINFDSFVMLFQLYEDFQKYQRDLQQKGKFQEQYHYFERNNMNLQINNEKMMKEYPEFQKTQKVIQNKLIEKQIPNETIDEISQSFNQSVISKIQSCKQGNILNSQCFSEYNELVSFDMTKSNSKFAPKVSVESSLFNSFNRNILLKRKPYQIHQN